MPRIFEKIYNEAAAKAEGGIKGKIFSKAIEVGREVRQLERKGESPGPVLKAEYELADKQIFSTVRDLFGGRLELALTGAAPVAVEMLEFFDACGVLVLEAYGLTETSGGATANLPDDFKFGTQGKALPNTEIKIAEPDEEDSDEEGEDPGGEVLLRGPQIFKGYYRNEEATDEDLDSDGWFSTGDVGSVDDDGFLTITGRTKDIVVTSSGKNIPAGADRERDLRQPLDLPGGGLRRRQELPRRADHHRRGRALEARLTGRRGRRPRGDGVVRRGARGDLEGHRRGQRQLRQDRAGQEVHDPRARPVTGRG